MSDEDNDDQDNYSLKSLIDELEDEVAQIPEVQRRALNAEVASTVPNHSISSVNETGNSLFDSAFHIPFLHS